jgi:hypothetical protein
MNTLIETLQRRIAEQDRTILEQERSLARAENAHIVLMGYYHEHKKIIDALREKLNRK